MSHFIEDDPNFYKRNSIFEEDHLDDNEDDDEISFWCEETEEECIERIRAHEEFRRKAEQEEEEYREYCEEMNRLEAVYYGREDYM